jgi:prepilin-type N-terminal cleavage/methylation domain-containing protein
MTMVRNYRIRGGFTIAELLTVLAIIAVLSAILFPVFRTAKSAAHRSVCMSNFRQSNLASQMYLGDYNDTFMPVNYDINNFNNAEIDRTWVQLLMPYTTSMGTFVCPGDFGTRPRGEGAFDVDLVIGDPYKRWYRSSLRSNVGYNYLYFSPVFRSANRWMTMPRTLGEITNTSESIMFVDSVYGRHPNGSPYGGGSYIVIPPCRYARQGTTLIDTFGIGNAQAYAPNSGWLVSNPNSPFRFGLAYPWHIERMNVGRVSGGTVSIRAERLSEGCDARNNWTGMILDSGKYGWDHN